MVTLMLVTSLCWWLYGGDSFEMLVTESLCWRLFLLCWWFSQYIKSVTNILNRSPTSQTCHKHIWSPTSVTNIDVTLMMSPTHPMSFLSSLTNLSYYIFTNWSHYWYLRWVGNCYWHGIEWWREEVVLSRKVPWRKYK